MSKIEGYGISLNMGGIDLMDIESPNPDPEVIAANKALEGQTFTCKVAFNPEFIPPTPEPNDWVITYIDNRPRKRKKRPKGTMIKHSKRRVDKCKVTKVFGGVASLFEDGMVTVKGMYQ